MATPRNPQARETQAHQKRVQQIAAEAAEKVAADSPLEEDVIVVVEELPPGEPARTRRGRTTGAEGEAEDAVLGILAQAQQLMTDGLSRWIDVTTAPFANRATAMPTLVEMFDARRVTQEAFRLAEELLASQKEFALKVAEAMAPAKAA